MSDIMNLSPEAVLHAACSEWPKPGFAEVITLALDAIPSYTLADEFEISCATLLRWAEGKSEPLPDQSPFLKCSGRLLNNYRNGTIL